MQPNNNFLEAEAGFWFPEHRSANLISAAANRRPSSAPPTLRTPSSPNCVMNARQNVASEIPDNSAAHQVTIGYDQVKHHFEDQSRIGLDSAFTQNLVYSS